AVAQAPEPGTADAGTAEADASLLGIPFAGTESETHRGVLVHVDYWIPIPEQWDLKENTRLEIHYSHSPVLISRLSSITGAINDNAVGSALLKLKDAARGVAVWNVPAEYLKPGETNKITLTAKMRSDLELCEDVHSPALWLTVHGDSKLGLRYREKPVTPDLSRFPGSYLRPDLFWADDAAEGTHATLLVPKNPSPEILNAVAVIGARMGVSTRFPRGAIRVLQVEKNDAALHEAIRDQNLIVVGPPQFTQAFIDKTADPTRSVPEALTAGGDGAGHILEWRNPLNPGRRLLVVTGSDDAALSKAVTALSMPHLSKQWEPTRVGDEVTTIYYASLLEKPEVSAAVANQEKDLYAISLADIGVSDLTFRGKFSHTTNVSFPNPFIGRTKNPVWMRFYISHSELLVPATSSLMIRINGEPVRSIRLTPRTARWLEADVLVPQRFLGERTLNTSLEFFLDIGDPDCHYNYPEMAWATVFNTSFVGYPLGEGSTESLRSYPWAVGKEAHLNGLTFVVGDEATDTDLSAVANIAAYLGRELPRKTDHRGEIAAQWVHPWVKTVGNIKGGDLAEQDLIVIGNYDVLKQNAQIQGKVPELLFSETATSGDVGAFNASEFRKNSGWIHLTSSPMNESGRNLLVISGQGGERAIEQAAQYLWVHRKVERLSGRSVIVGPNGSLQVVEPAKGEDPGQASKTPMRPRVPQEPLETMAENQNDPKTATQPAPADATAAPAAAPAGAPNRVAYLMFVLLGLLLLVLVVFRIRDALRADAS
ncbi:MAG: hypothetical protein ACI9OJ_005300, partial [Myxococcota bacterium]